MKMAVKKAQKTASGPAKSRRGKAGAPPKQVAKKASAKQAAKPADEVVEKNGKRVRKQINRRDSDEQAERYVNRKLSHVDASRIKTLRNEDGLSIHNYVKAELKRKKCTQGRLSSTFAVQLFKSFNLEAGLWDDLPEPPKGETNEELYELVSLCHDENRFVRDV